MEIGNGILMIPKYDDENPWINLQFLIYERNKTETEKNVHTEYRVRLRIWERKNKNKQRDRENIKRVWKFLMFTKKK